MQATNDKQRRRETRHKILANLSAIVIAIDDLDRIAAEARNHLHLQDRFFFQQGINISEDESYGTKEDLVELYLDTCQMITRLEKARAHMNAACTLMHFYDYASNPAFGEFARAEAENL